MLQLDNELKILGICLIILFIYSSQDMLYVTYAIELKNNCVNPSTVQTICIIAVVRAIDFSETFWI